MAIFDKEVSFSCGKCGSRLFYKRPICRIDKVDGKLQETKLYTSLVCNHCEAVAIKELEED